MAQSGKAATRKAAVKPVEVEVPKGHDLERYQLFIDWLEKQDLNDSGLTAEQVLTVRSNYRTFMKSDVNQRYTAKQKADREAARKAKSTPTPTTTKGTKAKKVAAASKPRAGAKAQVTKKAAKGRRSQKAVA